MLHNVIMAGGGGTRFWPRSRVAHPKQFLTLTGDRSLLQMTCDRIQAKIPDERIWIITSSLHAGQVKEQLPSLPENHIVGEPCGRDTAACIGLGAALLVKEDPDAVMLVTPADHVIEPAAEFQRAVQVACNTLAEHPNALITFGITPTYPATGYGYIHCGKELMVRQGVPVYQVQSFKEKPTLEVAEQYLATGNYFWNGGIFVWNARTILEALKQRVPKVFDAVNKIADAWGTAQQEDIFRTEYEALSKISIDYAVMEHAKEVLVVKTLFTWDDVGSWLALERMHPQDAENNTILGNHCGIQTKDCLVVSDEQVLVTTIGVENLLIIQHGNAILVADKREEGTVKQLVEKLKSTGKEEYL